MIWKCRTELTHQLHHPFPPQYPLQPYRSSGDNSGLIRLSFLFQAFLLDILLMLRQMGRHIALLLNTLYNIGIVLGLFRSIYVILLHTKEEDEVGLA